MIIADTSVWIEFLKNNEPIFSFFEDRLNNREILGIECVFGELLHGCANENEIKIVKGYWENLPKTDEANVWIEAGEYSGRNATGCQFCIAINKKRNKILIKIIQVDKLEIHFV